MPRLGIDTVKVCNCARCGTLLLGESMHHRGDVPLVAGRLPCVAWRFWGRPYCPLCFDWACSVVCQLARRGVGPAEPVPAPEPAFDPFVRDGRPRPTAGTLAAA